MKRLICFFLAMTIPLQSFAAHVAPYTVIDIHINHETAQTMDFRIDGDPSDTYEMQRMYYFYSAGNYYSAIYQGKDQNGKTRWSNIDPSAPPEMIIQDDKAPPAQTNPSDTAAGPGSGNSNGSGGSAHEGALGAAIQTGIAQAIYRGLIFTPEFAAEMARLNQEIAANAEQTANNYEAIRSSLEQSQSKFALALNGFQKSLSQNTLPGTGFQYSSPDPALVSELQTIENVLRSVRTSDPNRRESRDWGLRLVQQSDQASALGDAETAEAFRKYSEVFADLAVGLDPITGPLRDVYEAFTGKNLVTGESLDGFDRTFAVVGALSFGFGSKIGKGLKIFNKIKNLDFVRAAAKTEAVVHHIERNVPQSRAAYDRYIRDLRKTMDRPVIKDPQLRKFVNERYWKDASTVGNGSTAAAIRVERIENLPVKGRYHTQKGQNSLVHFENWLKNNPEAATSDRTAVENMILELRDALEGHL
ncbi:pre-toxin TG domain-containing protein [Bdellovibrio bacteriovorus]|uniref:pre-toxin TG domain-containing protein n=1 Tax=Bdellovibrio bacteriovorus TaxID=959 RepID=UPI0021CF705B|nr:pre-toxin TG domain-containing protein [Bdellovibrio bacteriovorus]UXR63381.1 pre-toxin TG domain-containing protein [Bdellovibrio bacteriovorus]